MDIGRKIIVAGGALAAAALMTGAVNAQGLGGGRMYVKAIGGFTFPRNEDFDINGQAGGELDSGFNYDNGYALGAAIGYEMNPHLALEGEYMYRNADARFRNTDAGKNETESNAFMVNALYKFDGFGANGAFKPYAGAGLGVADFQVSTDEIGDLDSDYQFAYQLIGGIGYDVTPEWTVTGEVRYFGINDQDLDNDLVNFKAPYNSFDVLFGAAYKF